MSSLQVEKNLLTEEDIAYGEGLLVQQRQGIPFNLSKVRGFYPVNSVEELNALDPIKHPKAVLVSAGAVTFYSWNTLASAYAVLKTDGGLRDNLANSVDAAKGAALVGYDSRTVASALQSLEGRTHINTDLYRLNQVLTSLSNNLRCVITGDSLSFNGFGYDGPFTGLVNGAGYATANPFGLQSWAHLLRDLWVSSNGAYTPIADINRYTDCFSVTGPASSDLPNLGMNARALKYSFSSTSQKLNLRNRYVGAARLIVSYAPASEAVRFVVNGVEYDNTTPDGHYQGYGYMLVPVTGNVRITNVRKVIDATGGSLWIYGITSVGGVVPKLTGKGAYTSGQILSEYATLVAPYLPDVVFYIIGANDIAARVSVAAFKQNVGDFVDRVRASRPDAIVVLMSTPPTSSYTKAAAAPYILAGREIALEKACSFIDLWAALENVDPAYYRHDNIHFSKTGDGLVFNVVKKLTLPNVPIDTRKLVPQREAYMGFGVVETSAGPESFCATYHLDAVPALTVTSNALATEVTEVGYKLSGAVNTFYIDAPMGYRVASVMSMVFRPPYGRDIKQLKYHTWAEALVYLANGDTLLDITGCGLYVTVSFCRDVDHAL